MAQKESKIGSLGKFKRSGEDCHHSGRINKLAIRVAFIDADIIFAFRQTNSIARNTKISRCDASLARARQAEQSTLHPRPPQP